MLTGQFIAFNLYRVVRGFVLGKAEGGRGRGEAYVHELLGVGDGRFGADLLDDSVLDGAGVHRARGSGDGRELREWPGRNWSWGRRSWSLLGWDVGCRSSKLCDGKFSRISRPGRHIPGHVRSALLQHRATAGRQLLQPCFCFCFLILSAIFSNRISGHHLGESQAHSTSLTPPP